MAPKKGSKTYYFSRVKEAREALKNKAIELYELQVKIINEAIAAQDFETASKANQWLIEHLPADDEGSRMIDQSIDKPKEVVQQRGPSVNIGFALGGNTQKDPKQLSPVTIDIEPEEIPDIEAKVE